MIQYYNYKTGQSDDLGIGTDELALEHLPQSIAAQGMFKCYRALGLSILAAYINVLSACVGEEQPFPIKPELQNR